MATCKEDGSFSVVLTAEGKWKFYAIGTVNDKTVLQTKALDQLRKENDFKLFDPSLEKQYGRYINYMINNK